MNESANWLTYELKDVVDVNEAKFAVRNYIEQRDLRAILGLIHNDKRIHNAAEFGCGYGRMTQVLAEFAKDVKGLEREPALVQEAQSNIPGIEFIQVNDLREKVLEKHSQDLVLTFTFLQHVSRPVIQGLCQTISESVKPQGYVVLCEESDTTHIDGETENPLGRCTIGRSAGEYQELFPEFQIQYSTPRRIEPGYSRPNTGDYLIMKKTK